VPEPDRSSIGASVRPATDDDVADLVRLDERARAHLRPLRGGAMYLLHTARPDPAEPSLRADLDDPDRRVVLGCIGGEPVGYGVAGVHELADGSSVADVHELFVEPEARGVGIGHVLLDSLIVWARERGCVGIDARALPGDRSTKNFFESFGLVTRALTVHRDLRD
jgi:GNAT superfamily N-acetyltransferase